MPHEAVHLPTEPEALHAIIAQKEAEIARLSSHLQLLQEQLTLLTAKRLGPRSETYYPDQFRLFNEAEVEVAAIPEEDQVQLIASKIFGLSSVWRTT